MLTVNSANCCYLILLALILVVKYLKMNDFCVLHTVKLVNVSSDNIDGDTFQV